MCKLQCKETAFLIMGRAEGETVEHVTAFLNVALRAGCSTDIWGRKVPNSATPVLKVDM